MDSDRIPYHGQPLDSTGQENFEYPVPSVVLVSIANQVWVLSIADSGVNDFVSLNGIGFQGVHIFPFIEWIGRVVVLLFLPWVFLAGLAGLGLPFRPSRGLLWTAWIIK
jgi:predicted cation transporter